MSVHHSLGVKNRQGTTTVVTEDHPQDCMCCYGYSKGQLVGKSEFVFIIILSRGIKSLLGETCNTVV